MATEPAYERPEAQRVLTPAGEQHDGDVADLAATEHEDTDTIGPQRGPLDTVVGRIGVLDDARE